MDSFFAELKRRHIYRVAAAYAVVSWALLQLVNNIAPLLRLPDWAGSFFLVMLAVGFPIALIFAWTMELKRPLAAERAAPSKTDWILTGALAAVIALILYEQLAPRQTSTTTVQAIVAAPTQTTPSGISIAVLPFVNLSGDAGQEFFSDGMTEEITSALAKIPALRVVARTSAFAFKGQNQDVRGVGQALGASHLIEGSVRKAGDRVRITAQLIKADDGTHLWTENYDRQLTDIFATQEDIAEAIAGALRLPLGLPQGEKLVSNRTGDLDSYQEYLRARALYRSLSYRDAIAILEPLVVRDPNYAPGWSLLARAYGGVRASDLSLRSGPIEATRRSILASIDKEEAAVRQAIRLDPRHAEGYAALATLQAFHKNWAEGDDLYRRAFALDPEDIDALVNNSLGLNIRGRLKQALAVAETLRAVEPLVPIYGVIVASMLQFNGQTEASLPLLEPIPAVGLSGYYRNLFIAKGYAATGRFGDAADAILTMPPQSPVTRRSIEDAARLIRSAPAKVNAPERLPALEGELGFVYAYIGAPERVFEFAERMMQLGYGSGGGLISLWDPQNAPIRRTERFKAIVRANGLVDYWRARGWPDLCRPIGADDFVCD